MKILVISNYRPYHTARPEAEIFIGLSKLGIEIDIMTYGDAAYFNKFKEAGINVIDFHPEKKMDKGEIAFIRKHLIEGKHDIIKLYNNFSCLSTPVSKPFLISPMAVCILFSLCLAE